MRVLHAYKAYRPDVDGGVAAVIALLTAAGEEDLRSEILVARGMRGLGQSTAFDGVPSRAVASLGNLFGMPIAPQFPLALAWAIRKADVVALHAPFPLNDIGALAVPDHVGVVVHWHAEILGRRLLAGALAPLTRATLARADRIIVSDQIIAQNSALLRPHLAKCEAVPFGVDAAAWATLGADGCARAEALRRRHPRLIVALGRLVPYKGFDVLLAALPRIDGHLSIVGTGAERERLAQIAADAGVSNRVTFAGYLSAEEVRVHLRAARVFAFPSVTAAETFGISQLEAMAAGLPIVNTALPTAVPLVARHGLEALTVPPRDAAALASAINAVLDDPELAERLGRAAQARAREQFDHARFCARVRAIYREVYDARRG
ncbi:glycosyltransferase [Rhodopseudomonas palustris]|uniref:Glycosyl transferase, group 1 n=1 Tax=Rhodopseudomonas palustris (strain BisB18) TaxID=316056 RepID=Q20YQ6_RHOPB